MGITEVTVEYTFTHDSAESGELTFNDTWNIDLGGDVEMQVKRMISIDLDHNPVSPVLKLTDVRVTQWDTGITGLLRELNTAIDNSGALDD